jgi:hypothetical protein
MKGFLIMDRRWNFPEQESKRVEEEGQPSRSSHHHFIYRSPETSLTPKEQMSDESSDKRTETSKLWYESKWTETVEPQYRKAWTRFFKKNQNKGSWIKEAITKLEKKCYEEWNKSFAPYNKWRDDMIKRFKKDNIPYNEKLLNSGWYNDWEQVYSREFMIFSQSKLNHFMEDKFINSVHNVFITMMQKKFINGNSQDITIEEMNTLFHISADDLQEYIQRRFKFDKFAKCCFNELTDNEQQKDQEDQEEIFYLEL